MKPGCYVITGNRRCLVNGLRPELNNEGEQ
jgi:hypothetical protein